MCAKGFLRSACKTHLHTITHSLTHSPPNIHHTHTLFAHAFTGDRGAARGKGPPTSDAQTLYQARP